MDRLQLTVLKAMLSKEGWAEYADIITPELLKSNGRAIFTHIKRLHGIGGTDITPAALQLDIGAQYEDERKDELCNLVDEITETEEVDGAALKNAVKRFAIRQLLDEASLYIASNLHSDDLDPAIPSNLVERAMEIGSIADAEVSDLNDTELPRWNDDRPDICSLGISDELDSCLGGGVAAGEFALVVAPPKRGKTSYLCGIGAHAASQGRKVLHITLEISKARVMRRYDQALTHLTRAEMVEQWPTVREGRKKIYEKAGGFVKVQDWSYQKPKVSQVEGLVRRMRSKKMGVDFIIIDYLKHMRPDHMPGSRYELRHFYGELGQQIRAMAVRLQVPVVTAWQINRQGARIDTVTEENLSECWDLAMECDIMLALNQTESERRENIMRMGVLYQRISSARPVVELRSNMDRMIIKDIKDAEIVDQTKLGDLNDGHSETSGATDTGT